ncbi:MAG TPA: FMN-binding negative transcriptional regulator [Bryobacteraceae bacterium]|jgi:transcriptional regulator
MYTPAAFVETRAELIEAAIAAYPLATLVTLGSQGLEASHVPLLYCRAEGGLGVLRGHLAKANPQWRNYSPGAEALAIFTGPQHYVTPAWYASTKEHGKVVPTWNYVAVHARGTLTIAHDPEWLLENVRALTDRREQGSESPWKVTDAPSGYIESQLAAIVGIELTITKLEGKWKVSQNRPLRDRQGVIAGLENLDSPDAREMASLVKAALAAKAEQA